MRSITVLTMGVVVVVLGSAPTTAQTTTCPLGSSLVMLSLPNGNEKSLCLPDQAVEKLETAPGQAGGVIDVAECPCDFSTDFIQTLDWDVFSARCEDFAQEPREIVFGLTDYVAGLGNNALYITGGTFSKGNRCTATVTIGGTWFSNLQEENNLTNGEVSACIKDLAAGAAYLGVPSQCE